MESLQIYRPRIVENQTQIVSKDELNQRQKYKFDLCFQLCLYLGCH